MIEVEHPVYQNRQKDADEVEMIIPDSRLSAAVREAVATGGVVTFGYWRPSYFNPLVTLVVLDECAVMRSAIEGDDMPIVEKQIVPRSAYDGDPDVLYGKWLTFKGTAQSRDMHEREDNVRARNADEQMLVTVFEGGAEAKRGEIGRDALSIRLALQEKTGLIYGHREGTEMKPVATLRWTVPGGIEIEGQGSKRAFHGPPDLDQVTDVWMQFCVQARQDWSFDRLLAGKRANAAARGEQGPA